MAGLWFKPVCDDLLGKIHRWWVNYERGEIFSTREWLDREGNKVDKLNTLCLQDTLQAFGDPAPGLDPGGLGASELADQGHEGSPRKHEAPLQQSASKEWYVLLATGEWVITLAWYKADIEEVLTLLLEAKSGKSQTVESLAEQQKAQGKELFEV